MDTRNFCNLTPHTVVVQCGDTTHTFPASGKLARVSTCEAVAAPVLGIPSILRVLGTVEIPAIPTVDPGDGAEPFEPYWLVVSSMVLDAAIATKHPLAGRMLAPDTGPTAIREGGQVKAVTRFVRA